MNARRLGLVAAAATLLAAAPMSAIFERWTWLIESFIAVALVASAAALARWLRAPVWTQLLAMLGALLLALTWMFPSGAELLALGPTPGTFAHFGKLLSASVDDMRSYGIKVPDTNPLLFITVLGVGGVAVVVDLLTVSLRRPALAGLPMLAIYSVPVAVYVDSVPPAPFIVGAIGFLWLLVADNVERVRRFGRRFTGDGRDVDVWEPSPLAAAGRRLAVVGVVLAVLLPLAVPGMTGGLLNRYSGADGDGTGGTGRGGAQGRIDLFASLSGQLNQSDVVTLAKVRTDDPNPFYLRFGVADELQPDGFRVRIPSGNPANRDLPDPSENARSGITYARHRAHVELTSNFNMPLLPVYAEPVATQSLDSSWLYDPERQIVFSKRGLSKGKKYSFDYVRSTYSPAALSAATSLPENHPVQRKYTITPPVREVEELVTRLTKNKRTDYDRVRAIYDYFSLDNGFTYSLRTEGGTSGQDIVDFLTNKVGFCQQYAAALAWLVRAAGIPARVAFGFTNGSSVQDGTYTLTNRNLHAWTEVYFDGAGWVPFDATPAASVPGSTRTAWAPDTDAPDPITPSTGPTSAAGVNPSAGPGGIDQPERDPDAGLDLSGNPVQQQRQSWPWWAAGVVLVLVLLALPALRRTMLRRRRSPRAVPAETRVVLPPAGGSPPPGVAWVVGAEADRARAEAHAAWDELIDTLVDFRLRVDPTETPRATADRLVQANLNGGPVADAARLLGRAEERARYARDPLQSGQLSESLRSVRRALAAGVSRRTRLLAVTLPPSVLLRWRMAVMDRSSRFVAANGRLRTTLRSRSNPRRLLASRPAR